MNTMKRYENLNSTAFSQRLKETSEAVLLDVRTKEEHEEGHIPNSINLNILDGSFHEGVNSLNKSKTYFVYCRSGGRSERACAIMENLGFTAINLVGGISSWTGEIVE